LIVFRPESSRVSSPRHDIDLDNSLTPSFVAPVGNGMRDSPCWARLAQRCAVIRRPLWQRKPFQRLGINERHGFIEFEEALNRRLEPRN